MTKIQSATDVSNLKDIEQLKRFVSIALNEFKDIVNGNLTFGENIKTKLLNVTFSGVEASVSHGLGFVPNGYIIVGKSGDFNVYNGTTAWTTTNLFLLASGNGSAKILVF